MAESLEGRVKRLKSRLEDLKLLYIDKERPTAVDLEIAVLKEQIETLIEPTVDQNAFH